jgi:hypothetical protein
VRRAGTMQAHCRSVAGPATLAATQPPHKTHASITGQGAEILCFCLDEALALDKGEELGTGRAAVQGLPLGRYVAWSHLNRARLAGRVFQARAKSGATLAKWS